MIRKQIMGLAVDDLTLEGAVEAAMAHMRAGRVCRVVTPNAEFALAAQRDARFSEVLNTSQLILPDGIGVVLASRIVGQPLGQKVAGVDFAEQLCRAMAAEGKRLYILGARPGVAQKAAENLCAKYPGLVAAGTHHGYYQDEAAVVRQVAEARPDALFVAMGAPRSELFMAEYQGRLGALVMAGIGGSVDIFAGDAERAPDIFIKLGLEWLYRLIREPRRISRMARLPLYLLDAVIFRIKGGEPRRRGS